MVPQNRDHHARPDAGFPARARRAAPAATASSAACTGAAAASARPTSTGRPTGTTGSSSAASSPSTTSTATASAELTSAGFQDAYKEKPIRWNAFVEDRLDLGDVVVVGGVRYDCYDSRAPAGPGTGSPGISTIPRISTMPGSIRPTRPPLFVRDQSHNYVSPHVQVSFPVTDRTNFRLSLRAPGAGARLRRCSSGINTDINRTNTNQLYGSDLDFGRTIAFEFGMRHAFSDDMVLDIAAYNRDIAVRRRPAGWSRCSTRRAGPRQRDPDADQRGLRQHPRHGRPARPPVRQLLQRHAGLHLPAGQEHGLRSGHLHRLRLPHREPGRRRQRRRRRRRSCRPTPAGRTRWPAPAPSPSRATGNRARRSGIDPAERRRVRDLPVHQRHARTPVRRERRGAERPLERELRCGSSPRASTACGCPRSSSSTPGSPRASAWAGWT